MRFCVLAGLVVSNGHPLERKVRSRRRRLDEQHCTIRKRYVASSWELEWRQTIDSVATNDSAWDRGCAKLRSRRDLVEAWLKLAALRRNTSIEVPLERGRHEVFGVHVVESSCGGKKVIPIEPLVGFLRHPLHHCFHRTYDIVYDDGEKARVSEDRIKSVGTTFDVGMKIQAQYKGRGSKYYPGEITRVHRDWTYRLDKGYMLPMFRDEIAPKLHSRKRRHGGGPMRHGGPMSFYFDLGASTYRSGFGGASMSWFVDEYDRRGITFDRILAWEAIPQNHSLLLQGFDAFPLARLSYFNTEADPTPGAKLNPLTMLQDLCYPDDFVVLKIDIDNNPVENAFIRSIVHNPSIAALLDELYWENHVLRSPMMFMGWQGTPGLNSSSSVEEDETAPVEGLSFAAVASADLAHRGPVRGPNDITHSYELFHALRERGIRAHSWV